MSNDSKRFSKEGMKDFLQEFSKYDFPKIIASSTLISNLNFFLKETVLGEYFDSFVSAEEVQYGKPAPDVFLEAARRIQVPIENCIVLEDSPAGMLSGREAGAYVIGLETTHSKDKLNNYHKIYQGPHELNLMNVIKDFQSYKD